MHGFEAALHDDALAQFMQSFILKDRHVTVALILLCGYSLEICRRLLRWSTSILVQTNKHFEEGPWILPPSPLFVWLSEMLSPGGVLPLCCTSASHHCDAALFVDMEAL